MHFPPRPSFGPITISSTTYQPTGLVLSGGVTPSLSDNVLTLTFPAAGLSSVTADSPLSGQGTGADHLVLGTVPVSKGGTNLTSYTTGDLLYASGAGTLAKLAAGTSGYYLTAAGAGVAPSYTNPATTYLARAAGSGNALSGALYVHTAAPAIRSQSGNALNILADKTAATAIPLVFDTADQDTTNYHTAFRCGGKSYLQMQGDPVLHGTYLTAIDASDGTTTLGYLLFKSTGISTSLSIVPSSDYGVDLGSTSLRYGNLYYRHLVSGSTTPGIAAGTGAGTGPTIAYTGTDACGYLSLTTGTLPAGSATVATLTYNVAYGAAPSVTITPASAAAAALSVTAQVYVDQATSTSSAAVIKVGLTGLAASTAYVWWIRVGQ